MNLSSYDATLLYLNLIKLTNDEFSVQSLSRGPASDKTISYSPPVTS